jgi:hypothetical protein
VSTVYIASFGGGLASGLVNVYLNDRLGITIVALIGALAQALSYALLCFGGPYPLFVIAFVFSGLGFGLLVSVVGDMFSLPMSPLPILSFLNLSRSALLFLCVSINLRFYYSAFPFHLSYPAPCPSLPLSLSPSLPLSCPLFTALCLYLSAANLLLHFRLVFFPSHSLLLTSDTLPPRCHLHSGSAPLLSCPLPLLPRRPTYIFLLLLILSIIHRD